MCDIYLLLNPVFLLELLLGEFIDQKALPFAYKIETCLTTSHLEIFLKLLQNTKASLEFFEIVFPETFGLHMTIITLFNAEFLNHLFYAHFYAGFYSCCYKQGIIIHE